VKRFAVPGAVVAVVTLVLVVGAILLRRAEAGVSQIALADQPKAVTAVEVRTSPFRGVRRYVGTLEPWQEARVGPQLASGIVGTVLVRPGDKVKKNQVVATLDCRNASAANRAIVAQATALEARQRAATREAARLEELLDGGFVSPNEVEQKQALTASNAAQLESLMAQSQGRQLEVNDCVLRAPFEGEIATRYLDPGAFVHPGTTLLTIVDRGIVRLVADVPEVDFAVVAPATPARVRLMATGTDVPGVIARRSPAGDAQTRTIHFEVDLSDPDRVIPVGTTAEIEIDVGDEIEALEMPLSAARIRGGRATVFVVRGEKVEKAVLDVVGERGGSVFVKPGIEPGSRVVTQGRSLLSSGDRVVAKVEAQE
jgi:membrane fusion protein, multidrug efflux system